MIYLIMDLSSIGKPTGIDVKEKKMTLPLIHALNNATRSEKRHIINLVKNHSHETAKVKEVVDFAIEKGGLEYSIEKMNRYKEKSLEILMKLPENDSRNALEALIHFATNRTK